MGKRKKEMILPGMMVPPQEMRATLTPGRGPFLGFLKSPGQRGFRGKGGVYKGGKGGQPGLPTGNGGPTERRGGPAPKGKGVPPGGAGKTKGQLPFTPALRQPGGTTGIWGPQSRLPGGNLMHAGIGGRRF